MIPGCTDPMALNYNFFATVDNGIRLFAGRQDPAADNYNPDAAFDNETACPGPHRPHRIERRRDGQRRRRILRLPGHGLDDNYDFVTVTMACSTSAWTLVRNYDAKANVDDGLDSVLPWLYGSRRP